MLIGYTPKQNVFGVKEKKRIRLRAEINEIKNRKTTAKIDKIKSWFFEKISNTDKPLLTTAKSLQSCPTLCDPIDGSPPGSPSPGILQARTLEWVAISFSNA